MYVYEQRNGEFILRETFRVLPGNPPKVEIANLGNGLAPGQTRAFQWLLVSRDRADNFAEAGRFDFYIRKLSPLSEQCNRAFLLSLIPCSACVSNDPVIYPFGSACCFQVPSHPS